MGRSARRFLGPLARLLRPEPVVATVGGLEAAWLSARLGELAQAQADARSRLDHVVAQADQLLVRADQRLVAEDATRADLHDGLAAIRAAGEAARATGRDETGPAAPPPLVVIGAGGHAKVVIEAIRAANGTVVGVLDPEPAGPDVLGVPVIGDDEMLEQLRREGVTAAFVALGGNGLRARVAARALALGFTLPALAHPSALVSPSARLGAGAIVMAGAVVGVATTVDDLAIINTGAVLDHDNRIGQAAHVAPGCALAGNVRVGARTLIGVGSAVRPDTVIGADVVVGAGSAVVSDIPDGAVVGGTPARPLRPKQTHAEPPHPGARAP